MTKYEFHKLRLENTTEYWRLRWIEYRKTHPLLPRSPPMSRHEYYAWRWRTFHNRGISSKNATHARKYRKNYCEVCGSQENLVAHHRNFNQNDNRLENILTLCFACHNHIHANFRRRKNEERSENS